MTGGAPNTCAIDERFARERKERLLSIDDDALRRHRSYFCELEWNTNRLLLPFNVDLGKVDRFRRREQIETAVVYQARRLVCRLNGADPRAAAAFPGSREHYAPLSRLQLGLLRKHYGDDAGGLDLALVRDAFDRFASGDLRMGKDGLHPGPGAADAHQTLDCEPSGDFYFHFAEFAFVAIELGIDSIEWRRLLPILVATQSAFLRAYAPPEGSRRMGAFSPAHYDSNHARRLPPDRLRRTHAICLRSSLDRLAQRTSANVRAAFADERPAAIVAA